MTFARARRTALLFSLLSVFLFTTGLRCTFITPSQKELLQPIELTWWGVFDDSTSFQDIINDYRAQHPNISINYRKLRPEEFETELLNALAEDRGPDIFTIHNTWIGGYVNKIEALPSKTKMAYQVTQKSLGIKEETIIEVRETTSLTPEQLKQRFIDVVSDDVLRGGKIYGLPLAVDTLALYYNRDLLNNAGIPLPPDNWLTLQENVKKLTFQDKDRKLVQSGIAIGTGINVERATDILSLLMMQNGAEMTRGNIVTFGVVPQNTADRSYNPGPEAVRFYTDFANDSREVYTWDPAFSNSIDAFAEGRVALLFAYNYHIPYLEAKRQGKLNYGITKAPQIKGRPEVNFANYWVQVVSKKSTHINEAWDFLQFATRAEEAKKYLDKTVRPTALRELIPAQSADDRLREFAEQLLTAKSWYRGNNATATEKALSDLIEAVRSGAVLQDAINVAALKIQQTL